MTTIDTSRSDGNVALTQTFTLDGYVCEFTAVVGRLTPKEIWDTKDKWHAFVENSRGIWEQMDENRREGIVMTVKSGIERLYDTVEQWLPESLEVSSSVYLDVHFKILFTDVDAEVQRDLQATTFRIRDAEKEARAMIEELD